MLTFADAPLWLRGGMGVWCLAALFAGLGLLAQDADRRDPRRWEMVPVMLLLYFSFQCITCINAEGFTASDSDAAAAWFAGLPLPLPVGSLLIVSALEFRRSLVQRRWIRSHLTRASIKEAVDALPAGVCGYEDNGHILLKNTAMDGLCRRFTGEPLLNGAVFAERVREKTVYLEGRAILAGEGKAYSLEERTVCAGGRRLRILTASDITEEYRKLQELSRKRKDVLRLNEKLRAYNREITSVITQKEILRAKLQVHDVMGGALLSAKRYIACGGPEELKTELLEELTRGVDYLLTETDGGTKDPYQQILDTAEKLGARVLVTGELPADMRRRKLLSTAIHECLTNTIRHAGGDTVFVTLAERGEALTAELTGNGAPPAGPIEERGGLSSLRRLVEGSGGAMTVSTGDGLHLTITLPKEDNEDDL